MSDVYISGSLTHTPRESWDIYEKLGKVVEDFGLKPFIPHIHTPQNLNTTVEHIRSRYGNFDDSIHKAIFDNDIAFVENCKLVIAEVSSPSIGAGVEIGVALKAGKPVVCLVKNGTIVSSFITGPAQAGLVHLIRYENEEDALSQLKYLLETKFKSLIE